SPFPLAHASPHPVALVAPKCVVQAFDANGTVRTDALGLSGGTALLGEEDLRVVVPAPGPFLPRDEVMHHHPLPSESHWCNSEGRDHGLARGKFLPLLSSSQRIILPVFAIAFKGFWQKTLRSIRLTSFVNQADELGGRNGRSTAARACVC